MMEHEPWQRRRLTRSPRERMWAGVAGGLAEYFDVDPALMRLMWVVATVVTAGLFVAVYLVMWVIMPLESELPPSATWQTDAPPPPPAAEAGAYGPPDYWAHHMARKKRSAGLVLVVLGLLFLGAQSGIFHWINWSIAWAVVLIVLGAALLTRNRDWHM